MKTYASKDTIVEKQDIGYEVMDVDTETRRVKAVWARTGNIDLDNDIIVPEAFTKTLKERGPAGKNLIWSLVDHCAEMEAVIGKPEQLYIEGDMLIAITPIVETETGEDMIKMYDAGLINQHSIGFSTINSSVDKNGIRTISELKLYEGSAVLWAANPETPTISVKSEVKKPSPSVVGPVNFSTACSGCGMMPTTFPRSFVIPAMSRREPFGLISRYRAMTRPSDSSWSKVFSSATNPPSPFFSGIKIS